MPTFWFALFTFAAAVGVFLALVLALFSKRRKANIFLSILLVSWSLIILQSIIYWTGYQQSIPYFKRLYVYLQVLIAPLPYLYLIMLNSQGKDRVNVWLHFIPFILSGFSFMPYYLLSSNKFLGLFHSGSDQVFFNTIRHVSALMHLFYTAVLWVTLGRWKKKVDLFRFRWYVAVIGLYSFYVLCYFFYRLFHRMDFFTDHWDYVTMVFLTVSLIGIGILSYLFPFLVHDHNLRKVVFGERYSSSNISNKRAKEVASKIDSCLINERIYRKDISLAQFSSILDLPRNQLSQIVNQEFGCTFPELINQHRINDAKDQIVAHRDKTIKEIYYDVGYTNKASFYSHFKKNTGITPTQFRKRLKSSTD